MAEKLPTLCGYKYHILGDGAYGIREYLLTPFKDFGHLTPEQQLYNKKFCSTRVTIENTFGIFKSRFRQLLLLDMHTVSRLTKFIIACCVLHNLCIDNCDSLHDSELVSEAQGNSDTYQDREFDNESKRKGERKRDTIANSLIYL